jgi:hypothetical protein
MSTGAPTTVRFNTSRRSLVVLFTVIAVGWAGLSVPMAKDGAWFRLAFGLVLAVGNGLTAWLHARRRVVITDEELAVTHDLRTERVHWSAVERVTLDWAAAAAGRDPEAFRTERRDGSRLRSAAVMGLVDDRADELEAALRRRAEEHGFELEVHHPSWDRRSRA